MNQDATSATRLRRLLFLAMLLAVGLPLLLPLSFTSERVSPEGESFFARLDAVAPGATVLFSLDYAPDSAPEVEPMALAALQHLRHRGANAVLFTAVEDNQGQAERLMHRAIRAGFTYGEDLMFLGFRPDIRPLILSMAHSLRDNFPVDYQGVSLDEWPLTQGIERLEDFALVLSVASDDLCLDWITFGAGRFGTPLAMGLSANLYGTVKPFADSGEVQALLRGMVGAAEYETRLVDAGVLDRTGDASRGMGSQSAAHLLLVLLIVLGNLSAWRRGRP